MSESLWLTKKDAATLVGLQPRQFGDAFDGLPPAARRGHKRTLRFFAPEVIKVHVQRELARHGANLTEDGDPLMAGSDSPGLERYRLAKAALAERDLAEREGSIVRVQVLRDVLLPAVMAMRDTGDRLARKFGNDAAVEFNEGVDELESQVKQALAREEK